MKKIVLIITLICSIVVGCSSASLSSYDRIQSDLANMKGYYCEATVKYISNKSENEYGFNQYVKDTGEYSIKTTMPKEVDGNYILYDGNMIWQYNPRLDSKISIDVPDKIERKQILLFTFMENYTKSRESSVQTANSENEQYTVLEAEILGSNKFFSREKLWVSNKTLLPSKLVIYDEDDKERVILNFNKFEYNPEFEENTFTLDSVVNKN